MAEVQFAVEREMARSLCDILVRRLHVAFETEDHGAQAAERVLPVMGDILSWSDERRDAEMELWQAEMGELFGIEVGAPNGRSGASLLDGVPSEG
jgi:glycerol-3-phosphate dehydrogenase